MKLKPSERDALEKLVLAHQGRMRAFVARFEADRDVIDERLQDIFIAVIGRCEELAARDPEDAAAYLRGVARNLIRLAWRRKSRAARSGAKLAREIARRALSEDIDAPASLAEEYVEALRACIERLAAHARRLVHSFYFEGTPPTEMARAASRSAASLRMALLRVRRQLRTCIEARVPEASL